MAYPFNEIEKKWQNYWADNNVYFTEDDFSKPKYYILDMFPYPSGAGLHIGHPEGYTATDILARYKRSKGFNVLHPMGFDAFGLPTERYSMKHNIHPAEATKINVDNFKRQLNSIGFSYDWSREINTTDPNYYKWTQWMFLLIYNSWYDEVQQKARPIDELEIPKEINDPNLIEKYKDDHRLAYTAMIPVNWCEELGTVLANEEVEEWKSKGYKVERKPMRQYMIKITKYGDRLLKDLDLVEWPNSTRDMQVNWIGKSTGAELIFRTESEEGIVVFTTRPDTIFGASYLVLGPEHPLSLKLTTSDNLSQVQAYISSALEKSELERQDTAKEKTGIFTGSYAINPANGNKIPIWIADYVLGHYGTGAIMAVPGHDERDHQFATKFGLPILQVVAPSQDVEIDVQQQAFVEKSGYAYNSSNNEISISGLPTIEAINKIISWVESKGIGKSKVQFKLRDWLFSRQRYWGEPIPIIYFEDGTKRAMELDELPLLLPDVSDYKPAGTGESPLANVENWIHYFDKKTNKYGKIETNTMPQWAGSCWYYLRFIDPQNNDCFVDKAKEQYWMAGNGVDLYVGGAEHAVLHLLYARFWHKVLYDYGYVSTIEPFKKLFHQGLILGADGNKMSKSLGNVVNPDDIISEYGADSLRLYEMFLGPLEQVKPWQTNNIIGVFNFLNRAWRLVADDDGNVSDKIQAGATLSPELDYILNYTIKKVGEDIESLSFNTAIAQMMIFVNEFTKAPIRQKEAIEKFIIILSLFAPHIGEELWCKLGKNTSIILENYPTFDKAKAEKNTIEFIVQVASKIRGKLSINKGLSQEEIEELAKNEESIQRHLEGKEVKKVIFVKDKLINFIV
ncbi:MAG TPA: leucine--tRNA ligase [Candidatus Kapabacteria bacterium]|nr:leucine--tRNA ligase [Candidatus Kapabacteria bacterium]